MKLSDLQGSKGSRSGDAMARSVLDRETERDNFMTQLAATNSEIENAKYDIQQLMTKAHAFCKNSGLGADYGRLARTPPRFGDHAPVSATRLTAPQPDNKFFQSGPTLKMPE
jgi:hypothetical protein